MEPVQQRVTKILRLYETHWLCWSGCDWPRQRLSTQREGVVTVKISPSHHEQEG